MIMAGNDKKNLASILVGGMKPKDSLSEMKEANQQNFVDQAGDPGPEQSASEGLHAAAHEAMEALESKDVPAFLESMKALVSMIQDQPDDDDDEVGEQ